VADFLQGNLMNAFFFPKHTGEDDFVDLFPDSQLRDSFVNHKITRRIEFTLDYTNLWE
jgi:hypothetical protein